MSKKYDPHEIEPRILDFWKRNRTHEKAKKKGKKYYFLDGPPYTSGKVHIGTAWNKALKDCVLRYKRMKGFDVWDRAGYDMHGLPTENAVAKKFGLETKDDIIKYGVRKFVQECEKFAVSNMRVMNEDFTRLGVWMDFKNAYQSIKQDFMSGEWWLIKQAHKKGRLYEGQKTMHWCAHCATALAKHELEYKNVKDNSIFVKFPVVGKKNEFLIIWTTTPWTIPYNLAVMVHPDFDYVKAKVGDEIWIVAKGLSGVFLGNFAGKEYKIIEEFKGSELEGLHYHHPFEKYIKDYEEIRKKSEKLHSVVMSSEYVDLSGGTGLVHCAPGCGPEDYEVGYRNNLPPYNNLSEEGVFPEHMGKFKGLVAKKDDNKFIKALEDENVLIATSEIEHDYAHCWRCHAPVIFRTTTQWFFKIEDLKENMRELNKSIKWVPDWAGSRQFDSWLENLRDNSITRQRFWGTPVPIWKCNKCKNYEVIGSIGELKEKAGFIPENIHVPWIDEVTFSCEKCKGEMRRIPDILDVWIDAGTTSWTCLDFPQEKELFKKMFPPDFILEGKDQIRGWFNLLFVASMIGHESIAYKSVYMHGFVQDAQGRKMSKSLGNYIVPQEVIDKYGADTLRYYTISGANPGVDLNYNFDDMRIKSKNLHILWNLHNFVIDFAKEVGINPSTTNKARLDTEEKYILSRLNSTIKNVNELFEDYKLNEVPLRIEELFLDLSRTYLQLVREKSSLGKKEEKQAVLYTTFKVLLETLKLFAPVCPFITEEIYQNLKKEFNLKEESIHFFSYPTHDEGLINENLEKEFDIAKSAIQAILSARESAQLGVRWPVSSVVFVSEDDNVKSSLEVMEEIIKTQTNVKNVEVRSGFDKVKYSLKPSSRFWQEFKEDSHKLAEHIKKMDAQKTAATVAKNGKMPVTIGKKEYVIKEEHLEIERSVPEPYKEAEFRSGFAYLDCRRTKELDAEGFAREIMRRIQNERKKAGLKKQDEIHLFIETDDETEEMLKAWQDTIKEKVGATTLTFGAPHERFTNSSEEKIKGKKIKIFF
ncbi:isoleucine--tRNA ligase [Candidatus Woesearchaeota archaeon]|nr:MAG: isoleucine--tRNA ligase [Candidatus Woesearchaeota archaeon]